MTKGSHFVLFRTRQGGLHILHINKEPSAVTGSTSIQLARLTADSVPVQYSFLQPNPEHVTLAAQLSAAKPRTCHTCSTALHHNVADITVVFVVLADSTKGYARQSCQAQSRQRPCPAPLSATTAVLLQHW